MKRHARVDALLQRIGDINPGPHVCNRDINREEACRVCDIVDDLSDALADYERDEVLGLGDDLVDAELVAS